VFCHKPEILVPNRGIHFKLTGLHDLLTGPQNDFLVAWNDLVPAGRVL
jgi:hypothetical protein